MILLHLYMHRSMMTTIHSHLCGRNTIISLLIFTRPILTSKNSLAACMEYFVSHRHHHRQMHIQMPLSITCHHATTDGYHVKCFLESLQSDIDCFHEYL